MDDDLRPAFDKLRTAAKDLADITEGTSYGTPSLHVRKKFLCRVKDAQTIAVMCPLEEKDLLIEADPAIYFETAHYKGWPVVLVRVDIIGESELQHRLIQAWLMQAPKRLGKSRETLTDR